MPISRPGLFTFYINGCYSSVFFNRLVKILSQDPFRLLKTNKAFGLDKISARLLKDSVDVITPSLTNLQMNIVSYLHEYELQ